VAEIFTNWWPTKQSPLIPLLRAFAVSGAHLSSRPRVNNPRGSHGGSPWESRAASRPGHTPPPPNYKTQASCGFHNPRIEPHHHRCAGSHWERDSREGKCAAAMRDWLPASVDPRRLVGAPAKPPGEASVVFAVEKADRAAPIARRSTNAVFDSSAAVGSVVCALTIGMCTFDHDTDRFV
jgi:hypothetical protein